ncbi:MAG: AzlC family ABC transporter permease [Burkholderiaceae bacterium]
MPTPEPAPAARDLVFTRHGLRDGFVASSMMAIGAVAWGAAVGVLAQQKGLGFIESMAMSLLVYSGTAQMVTLQLWADPMPWLGIFIAALAFNARYILLGAALRPWLSGLGPWQVYGTLAVLGDSNWAMTLRRFLDGSRDAGFLLGSGLALYLGWAIGTALGTLAGTVISEPHRFGLDFFLPAFCATWTIAFWRGGGRLAEFGIAALVAVLVQRFVPGPWYIAAGAVAGSLAGLLRPLPRKPAHAR